MTRPVPAKPSRRRRDDDADLREDIRFLGRLLGDTIREQAGTEVFDLVESIRRTAIHYRREHDLPSLRHLDRTIGRLGAAHATNVVRAFSYFHHLANAAEDLHARHAQPTEGSITIALQRLRAAHISNKQIVAFFERARVEPVLTAHPTEVQRKSVLDRHRAVIDLLAARGARSAQEIDKALRREVLILWKTNELRLAKPTARRSSTRCRACTPRSRTASGRGPAWRRSCGWRAGSAAIATATRTSPRR